MLALLLVLVVSLVLVVLMWGLIRGTNTSQTTTRNKSSRPRMDILAVLETLRRQTMILLTRSATTTQTVIRSRRHIRVHR